MATPGKLPFGANWFEVDEKEVFTLKFVNGGEWKFDGKEIDKLTQLLNEYERQIGAVARELKRTKGSTIFVENTLGLISLKEGALEARFWGTEISALQDAIRRLK